MIIAVIFVPILVGFVLGYFFALPAIVAISVVVLVVGFVLRPKRRQEIEGLIGIMAWIILFSGMLAMWGTHLYITNTDLGISDFAQYIFRK